MRARWEKEDRAAAPGSIVVTEIPYGVQKSRLIEKIAELLNERKLPLLGDMRDEIGRRCPRRARAAAATSIPTMMMESLFRLTELESRFPLNMNVLVDGRVPQVLSLARRLQRMARPSPRSAVAPLALSPGAIEQAARRSSRGYLIAYLNSMR